MNISIFLAGIIGLLVIGLYAVLVARNLIKVIVALQILVKGAMLAMIAAGQLAGQPEVGESLALTVIVADTIVAVVGMALAVQVRRHFGTLDVKALSTLRR
jgi:NADH:ubiquinone oxidoreductase subunit K